MYIRFTPSYGRKIFASYDNNDKAYLYILKHGVGPGTLPSDVSIVKSKDLPNYYTAVWLDRFLTDYEMKQYDIPFETDINYYLDRIGYCQKDGDVVPCDEVEACDTIEADNNVTKYTLTPEGQEVFDVVHEIAGVWQVVISTHNNIMIVSDNYSVDAIKEFIDNVKSELRSLNLMYAVSKIDYYRSNLSDEGFRLVVTLKKAYSNEDIEGCDKVMASETNEDMIYWVQAYYSKPHEGLADDFATNDWDAAVDKLVEFANDGYYVMFENVASGEGYEYDPDEVRQALEFGDIYALRRLNSLYEG